ncbi:MAG: FUSC family protein [Thermoplasmata archaeon]
MNRAGDARRAGPGAPEPTPALAQTMERSLFRFDRSALDWEFGIVGALFLVVPVAIGAATGNPIPWVLIALGTFNVFLGQGSLDPSSRRRLAMVSVVANSAGFGVGSLVALTGPWEPLALAGALAAFQTLNLVPPARAVALSSSALVVIAIGLPVVAPAIAGVRVALILVGSLWGLAATLAWLAWDERSRARAAHPMARRWPAPLPPASVARVAVIVGVASSFAFLAGEHLGLSRDYWTALTVVVVVQVHFLETVGSALSRLGGTVLGALVGGALSILLGSTFLAVAAIGMLSAVVLGTRAASTSLYAFFLTPFVLLLLGMAFPAGWPLAEARVLATLLGGAVAVGTSAIVWLTTPRPDRGSGRHGKTPSPLLPEPCDSLPGRSGTDGPTSPSDRVRRTERGGRTGMRVDPVPEATGVPVPPRNGPGLHHGGQARIPGRRPRVLEHAAGEPTSYPVGPFLS